MVGHFRRPRTPPLGQQGRLPVVFENAHFRQRVHQRGSQQLLNVSRRYLVKLLDEIRANVLDQLTAEARELGMGY